MNKKIIITLTLSLLLGSSVIVIRYRYRKTESLKKITDIKEENEKNEEDIKPKKEKEKEDIPWQLTWKGEIYSLICSLLLSLCLAFFYLTCKEKEVILDHRLFCPVFFISFFFSELIFCPFGFALKKYKNKSYRERLLFIYSSLFKIITDAILLICLIIFLIIKHICSKKEETIEPGETSFHAFDK